MEVCFCFYSHSNLLLAKSSPLTVVNPLASPYDITLAAPTGTGRAPHEVLEPFQIKVFGMCDIIWPRELVKN